MSTAITNKRLGISNRQPTQEDIHKIAPLVNMMFGLCIVLEGYTVEQKSEIYDIACYLRAKVNEYAPHVAEEFGEWTDIVENHIKGTEFKNEDVIQWIIAKIYALKSEMTKNFRKFDSTFIFDGDNAVNRLKMLQKNYNAKIAPEMNILINKLMEE